MTLQNLSDEDLCYLLRLSSDVLPTNQGTPYSYDGTQRGLLVLSQKLPGELASIIEALSKCFYKLELDTMDAIHLERCGESIAIITSGSREVTKRIAIDMYLLKTEARRLRFLNRFGRALFATAVIAMGTAIALGVAV